MSNSSSKQSESTKSSTTTSRIAKTTSSQRTHQVTSSSSTSTISAAEIKASNALEAAKTFNNMKNSIDMTKTCPALPELKIADRSININELKKKLKSSFENLVDEDEPEPLVTFPDGNSPTTEIELPLSPVISVPDELSTTSSGTGGNIFDCFRLYLIKGTVEPNSLFIYELIYYTPKRNIIRKCNSAPW